MNNLQPEQDSFMIRQPKTLHMFCTYWIPETMLHLIQTWLPCIHIHSCFQFFHTTWRMSMKKLKQWYLHAKRLTGAMKPPWIILSRFQSEESFFWVTTKFLFHSDFGTLSEVLLASNQECISAFAYLSTKYDLKVFSKYIFTFKYKLSGIILLLSRCLQVLQKLIDELEWAHVTSSLHLYFLSGHQVKSFCVPTSMRPIFSLHEWSLHKTHWRKS